MDYLNNLDELENWEKVAYRIREEGMEYCFKNYSKFPEIKDKKFHRIRKSLIKKMDEMNLHIKNKIDELE